jgi:hypothetical protein
MDTKVIKLFICNSPCRIEKKNFQPGSRVFLVEQFTDTMFNYPCVKLVLGGWQGRTGKSFFDKHFNFICNSDQLNVSKSTLQKIMGGYDV